MKNPVLIFLITLAFCNCNNSQNQQITENKSETKATISNPNNGGEEIGYPKFTPTNNQYLGCWRSVKTSETVNYRLSFFHFTEKTIQTTEMPKPVSYSEINSNNYKDWFFLKTKFENSQLQSYLNINIVSNDEMTVGELVTENLDGEYKNYWDLKREQCEKIVSKFKK